MYLPHLPPKIPGSGRALFCFANSPTLNGLLCDFCSSGQDFAASFLQIPTHDGHPCYWLILLAAKRIADLHRRVCAHAGRTIKKPGSTHVEPGFFIWGVRLYVAAALRAARYAGSTTILSASGGPGFTPQALRTREVANSRLTLYFPTPLANTMSSPPVTAMFFIN